MASTTTTRRPFLTPGLIYDFSRQFSAFASYTEIFKPQNSRDVTGSYLDPIDGRSFEVGIKGEHFDGRFNTSLTLFETRQNNVATAVYDEETGEPILLPDGTQASSAIDGTRTRGFELEASGELRRRVECLASAGRATGIEDADGEGVRTFVPRTLIRLFTTWTPAALSKLTFGGGINWQSASHTFVGTPDGGTTLRQGDVTLLSIMARYQLTLERFRPVEWQQPARQEVLRARRIRQHVLRGARELVARGEPALLARKHRSSA